MERFAFNLLKLEMKLITLNTWKGKAFDPLMDFFVRNRDSADIFCLQEILNTPADRTSQDGCRVNLFTEIARRLPEHRGFFHALYDNKLPSGEVDFPLSYGLAMFVKKDLQLLGCGDRFIYQNRNEFDATDPKNKARILQFAQVSCAEKNLTVFNFHGLPHPAHKEDSDKRLVQCEKILNFTAGIAGPKILCGDFNLRPDTKSIGLIEDGFRNLVKDYAIRTTWSNLDTKHGSYPVDYIFASPEIRVINCRALPEEVSDHLPLEVEFSW